MSSCGNHTSLLSFRGDGCVRTGSGAAFPVFSPHYREFENREWRGHRVTLPDMTSQHVTSLPCLHSNLTSSSKSGSTLPGGLQSVTFRGGSPRSCRLTEPGNSCGPAQVPAHSPQGRRVGSQSRVACELEVAKFPENKLKRTPEMRNTMASVLMPLNTLSTYSSDCI